MAEGGSPVSYHPGYVGAFSTAQAEGAIPNGSRVEKTTDERGDAHKIGAQAVVLGSLFHPEHGFGYFVEWDDMPKTAVFIRGAKIGPARSITCPVCGMTSYHPKDVEHRYCGNCNRFHDSFTEEELRRGRGESSHVENEG